KDARLPIDARASLIVLAAQLQALHTMIGSIERRIVVQHRANEASKRLECIHGIGVIGASAITALVDDPGAFRSGRDFAAWIGLVPRQDSTGGKQMIGPNRQCIAAANKTGPMTRFARPRSAFARSGAFEGF